MAQIVAPPQEADLLEADLMKPPKFWSRLTQAWRTWVSNITGRVNDMSLVGTTAQRPTTGLYVSFGPYWDTSLGKPVWVAAVGPPAVWHDGAGAVS